MSSRPTMPDATPPEGYEWAVAPDGGPLEWRVATAGEAERYHCRHSARRPCPNRPVASLQRGRSAGRHYYCPDHMYGRWIEGGRVVSWRLRKAAGA